MRPKTGTLILLCVLLAGLSLVVPRAQAQKRIAAITAFRGEVVVLSGKTFKEVRSGLGLMHGDRVQTRDGQVEISFEDGALMKVRQHSSVMIQEREEKRGFWLFRTKRLARRITCYVGSLIFNSRMSKRKHYIQTPTAVCGLRGTEVNVVFDNVKLYVQVVSGAVDLEGAAELVPNAFAILDRVQARVLAEKNPVYGALAAAAGQPADERMILNATLVALDALLLNPYIPDEEKEILRKARDEVYQDLIDLGEAPPEPPMPEEPGMTRQPTPDPTTPEWQRYLEESPPPTSPAK
jgi:hypothetical protein